MPNRARAAGRIAEAERDRGGVMGRVGRHVQRAVDEEEEQTSHRDVEERRDGGSKLEIANRRIGNKKTIKSVSGEQ